MAVFSVCPLYSMGSGLSSSAIHGAPLNLAALMCTKQGCKDDLHTITSCVTGQGISPWATVTVRVLMSPLLLLGLEEEGAHTLPDKEAQLWEQEEL